MCVCRGGGVPGVCVCDTSHPVRYTTEELEELISGLVEWEEQRDSALKDNMTCLFSSFDNQ